MDLGRDYRGFAAEGIPNLLGAMTAWRRILVLLVLVSVPAYSSTLAEVGSTVESAVDFRVEEQVTERASDRATEQAVDQAADEATATVEDHVASRVDDRAASRATEEVSERAAEGVERQVRDGVADQAADVVAPTAGATAEEHVRNTLERTPANEAAAEAAEPLERGVEQNAGAAAGRAASAPGRAAVTPGQKGGATNGAPTGASTGGSPVPFVADVDPLGRAIEQDVLVLLVPDDELTVVRGLGMTVEREHSFPELGRTLLRLRVDPGVSLSQAAGLVREATADTAVDYNHLYELNAAASTEATAAAVTTPGPGSQSSPAFTIGAIDSALDADHPALAGVRLEQRDFVAGDAVRPVEHGTAIASILVQESERLSGLVPELLVAGVFFEREPDKVSATTESLIAALAWMVEREVDVVNMSFTGPPNQLLQVALEQTRQAGSRVVAAVGNNGPAGAPLYPAAYDGVIGVTAVDREERIYAYANRGRHVSFAARGVGVRVASTGGGYAEQDGTSLAAARAAAIVAASLERAGGAGVGEPEVLERLKASARDLGDEGFDETFGYGLIAPLEG